MPLKISEIVIGRDHVPALPVINVTVAIVINVVASFVVILTVKTDFASVLPDPVFQLWMVHVYAGIHDCHEHLLHGRQSLPSLGGLHSFQVALERVSRSVGSTGHAYQVVWLGVQEIGVLLQDCQDPRELAWFYLDYQRVELLDFVDILLYVDA